MEEKALFSDKALKRLIVPLLIEQVLTVTIGMADIIMVSSVGEAAVSGVSLVDSINILLINLLTAMATGGAVVCAQYLGRKMRETACIAANQLILGIGAISLALTIIALAGNPFILRLIFGKVDAGVMQSARIYFYLTAASYPFIGVYNGSAALCRAMGNSKLSMNTSMVINGLNIAGNALFVFVFKMGAGGVGLSTLLSRIVGAVIMVHIVKNQSLLIHIEPKFRFKFDKYILKKILSIGIPNGLENSVFQVGKILVQSLVASFGTAAIAANAVANTLASFGVIPGSAMSLALITVVGQAIGANRYDEAKMYIKKLLKKAHLYMGGLNLLLILLCPFIVKVYNLSPEASKLAIELAMIHCIFCVIIWPESFSLPNALRAANDGKFTMMVSLLSMWIFRIGLSYLFSRNFDLGVPGIWLAMIVDWVARSICFIVRIKSGRWLRGLLSKPPEPQETSS